MLRYEIKKVFSKSKNRIAVIVLFVILAITSILTINRVEYVDENGNSSVGISAVRDLREAKNQWAGYLTEDTLSKALEENRTINSSKEALSDDITEQNKAYAKKQGIAGIMDVIIYAFSDYRDYNYYVTDQISDDEVGTIYERRISTLKNWLESGEERFTQAEKDFMIQKYKKLKTPFYYEYMDGWAALLQNISTFILMLALVIGFLVSGIFSDEFQTKADSIFFSARFGRSRGISAKVGAGFCITTGFYLMFVFLYTFIVLFVLGADGASCPIQLDLWRSVYNITFLQAYLFIVVGGYITRTMIFHEAPHKLRTTLNDLMEAFGPDRRISLCRELTKLHEEVLRFTLAEAVAYYEENAPKGEYVLVVAGAAPKTGAVVTLEDGVAQVLALKEQGMRLKDAAKEVAEHTGLSKNELYAAALER